MRISPFHLLFGVLSFALAWSMGLAQGSETEWVFREDFREVDAHIPATAEDLTCDFLGFERFGSGRDQVKLSFHPEIPNDPHYLWNGLCEGPVLLAFPFVHGLDLTDADAWVSLQSKNVGGANLHVALSCEGRWFVQGGAVPQNADWTQDGIQLHGVEWFELNRDTAEFGERSEVPDWKAITGLGFVAPNKGGGSESCIRLDWFALHAKSAGSVQGKMYGVKAKDRPRNFFEGIAPFVRTALVADEGTRKNRIRRGVVVRSGPGLWACFDPDLLRWAVIWRTASVDSEPITRDSMAATSYPDRGAKANQAPRLKGDALVWSPELPGINAGDEPGPDLRKGHLSDGLTPVGPMPLGTARFSGVTVDSAGAMIEFTVAGTKFQDRVYGEGGTGFVRALHVGSSKRTFSLRISSEVGEIEGNRVLLEGEALPLVEFHGEGLQLRSDPRLGTWLVIAPGAARDIQVERSVDAPGAGGQGGSEGRQAWETGQEEAWKQSRSAEVVASPPTGRRQGPFRVRHLGLPDSNASERAVRPTDIAFTRNGDAWVTTLDGDVWRVQGLENENATWTRVATGIYEATNIEVDGSDRIFVLGRDQVTRLIDRDNDGWVDRYENAADAFWQTLHTRDYSMSMVAEPGGSFVIAKGGIRSSGQEHSEHSAHRGAILRVSADGPTEVLADGLRIPFVGRRQDGVLFASDQQGHWVPSSPLYRIGKDKPSFGFEPTRHREDKASPKPAADP
ncbi:MAG: hypothetical protein P1V35_06970, partial [Planctomycetota bacterium]|nr:hypothetical protein [Planctomycetota bacterium]